MREITYREILENINCGLVVFFEDDFVQPDTVEINENGLTTTNIIIENNNKKYFRTDEYNAIKVTIKNNKNQIKTYSPKYMIFQ